MKLISIKPYITEKGTILQEKNQYIVVVPTETNKIQIKQNIKFSYGVDVERVNIMNTPKKTRLVNRGKTMTKRPNHKKAIILIKKGQKLDLSKVKDKN